MVSLAIQSIKTVKPLQNLLNALPLKSALSAKCTIHAVTNWPFLSVILFSFILLRCLLSMRWSGTGWKPRWQNLVVALALSALSMCLTAKVRVRWTFNDDYISVLYIHIDNLLFSMLCLLCPD